MPEQTILPKEAAATCSDCAMVQKAGAPALAGYYFSPRSKCCTHHPHLPNYLVGGLLRSRSPALAEGRRRVRRRIAARLAVRPQGILRPQKYTVLLKKTEKDAFGRSGFLVCPYYEPKKGQCTIWPFRNGTCCTWFCKHAAGEDGRAFWGALKAYLQSAENALVQYALHQMGWEPAKIGVLHVPSRRLTSAELDDRPPSEQAYRQLWGDWVGREIQFYKQTCRLVSRLTPEDFERIEGVAQAVLLSEVRRRHRDMTTPTLPDTLKRNPALRVEQMTDTSAVLNGYSGSDPLEVSRRVYGMLDFFDGRRTNDEVIRRIRKQIGAKPTEDLLLWLYQFRILVDAKQP